MITKITPETTVKEICEVLEFMNKFEVRYSAITMCSDMSCEFRDGRNKLLCSNRDMCDYIEEHTQPKPTIEKFISLSDEEFSEYVYKILDDPAKSEILFDAIKEVLR